MPPGRRGRLLWELSFDVDCAASRGLVQLLLLWRVVLDRDCAGRRLGDLLATGELELVARWQEPERDVQMVLVGDEDGIAILIDILEAVLDPGVVG